MRPPLISRPALVALAAAAGAGAVAAVAWLGAGVASEASAATARSFATAAGARGPAGLRGPRGPIGAPGPAGGGPVVQTVTLNWQNGDFADRDRAEFRLPGIGTGAIVCRPDTQWLRVFPTDRKAEVTLWLVRQQTDLATGQLSAPTVRTARQTVFTGPDFNEGFNQYRGQQATSGTFIGILSSRGPKTSPGGAGPSPTTLRVTFNWDFTDSQAARCYVAAHLVTGS